MGDKQQFERDVLQHVGTLRGCNGVRREVA